MMKGDVEKEQAWVKGLFPLWIDKNGALDRNGKKKYVSGFQAPPLCFLCILITKKLYFLEQKSGAVLKIVIS